MLRFKRSLLITLGLLCALCITACGGAAKTNVAAQGGASTVTVAPTAQPQKTAEGVNVQPQNKPAKQVAGNQQGMQNTANTTQGVQNMQNNAQNNGAAGSATIVTSAQVNVNGQMMNVLTTGTGLSLYYRNSDPAPSSTCTGACAQTWPPFIVKGNLIPTDNFQGQLSVHNTVNGNQVEYNGRPLYTYSGDTVKGQLNGQGADNGVWNVVTTTPQKEHW